MKKVIDLFSGCGGFSVGFEKAKYQIVKAVEFDSDIAESYVLNHPNTIMLNDDIGNIDNDNYFRKGEADIIIGGPPCQGFSMAGARIRSNFTDDPRNYLFKHYLNVVKIVKPKAFILENVKGILNMNNGEIFKEIVKVFSDSNNFNGDNYNIYYKVVKATEFGIPQTRERVIIIGLLNKTINLDLIITKTKQLVLNEFPHYFDDVKVWDALSNLPLPTADGIIINPLCETEYQKFLSCSKINITNHNIPNHSKKAIERMKKVKCGENWEVLDEEIKSVHSGAYGRLSKDDYAPTITTRFDTPSGGRFTHPIYNRTLTPREAARIQSFPDDFIFKGSKGIICKQIGNAVPPKISYFFAKALEVIFND